MKTFLRLFLFTWSFVYFSPAQGADFPFEVPLSLPKFEQLDATLSADGGTVAVFLEFAYDSAGKIHCTANSTVNGKPVTCKATITKSSRGVSFTITAKSQVAPVENLTLVGVLGTNSTASVYNTMARAVYSGGAGRLSAAAQPVSITASPATAQIVASPQISVRNQISGTGQVAVSYSSNLVRTGLLRGNVSTNRLSFNLTQTPRTVSFSGVRSNDVYVGTLMVNAPPAREIIRNFTVPASAFPVRSGRAIFRGAVAVQQGQTPTNAPKVKVHIQSDLNGDGRIVGSERKTLLTDQQGRYQTPFNVQTDRPVVIEFVKSNYAQFSASYPVVTPGAVVVRNTLLQPLSTLNVSSNVARTDDGRLALENLPGDVRSVQGRVFNPNTETSQFPGQFADNQRNLLVSSVFSAVEAQDSRGRPVTNFASDVTLCMEVPRDTWSTIGDMTNGTSQIDVPFYYYDEVTGKWVRNGTDGWLEDTNRVKIPESELGNIRSGNYAGKVCAVGPIRHLSYWNVDWPVSTKSCVSGVIMDGTGTNRASGATITIRGLSYTGSSAPERMSPDGSFCAEVMRSESAGEDVDRDGVNGETQQVQVNVQYQGQTYSYGPYNTPVSQGNCDDGGCLAVGNLVLNEANRLAISSCTITGRVVYSGRATGGTSGLNAGDPVAGAVVMAYDPEAPELISSCSSTPGCQFSAITDANGNFSLNVSYLSGLTVSATKSESSGQSFDIYNGTASLSSCLLGTLNLEMDFTSVRFLLINLNDVNGEPIGGVVSNNDVLSGSIDLNGLDYFVYNLSPRPRPTATGLWATLNLYNPNMPTRPVGTLRLTVTSLDPLQGTWSTTGVSASGTWALEDIN